MFCLNPIDVLMFGVWAKLITCFKAYKLWVRILLVTEWRVSHETKKHIIDTKDVVGLLLGDVVSTKKIHPCKGCGWLASRRGTKYKKNNTSLQRMWLAY